MRALDQAHISYQALSYGIEDDLSAGLGGRIAQATGCDPARSFKTLVCKGAGKIYAVFCIPVLEMLDLKKAARVVGQKSLALLPIAEIEQVTGYVRGGVSPLGMKKTYPTCIDSSAQAFDRIYVSAGKKGMSVCLDPVDLARQTKALFAGVVAQAGPSADTTADADGTEQ